MIGMWLELGGLLLMEMEGCGGGKEGRCWIMGKDVRREFQGHRVLET